MENLSPAEKFIRAYLASQAAEHRVIIKSFPNHDRIFDIKDAAREYSVLLQKTIPVEEIDLFRGYEHEEESYLYKIDERGWLRAKEGGREIFFINAAKYPYPMATIREAEKRLKQRKYFSFGTFFVLAGIAALLIYLLRA